MSFAVLRRFALRLGLLCAAAGLAGPERARAEDDRAAPLVVVELFTSQGCSACPPADALLGDLAERGDVLALSLHVDYWDYLGWRDVFAHPMFTKRQKAYREAAGARSIYTPQMIVHGASALVGSRRDDVLAEIAQAHAAPAPAQVELMREGDRIEVRVAPTGTAAPAAIAWYVTYRTPAPVVIKRGENAGRALIYRNVVDGWMKLGAWDGQGTIVWTPPAPAQEGGVAVILQAGQGYGPILAAARLQD
ncbi:MAG: DUF1223 domain-containing protein [Pseudomonadota bacterium]